LDIFESGVAKEKHGPNNLCMYSKYCIFPVGLMGGTVAKLDGTKTHTHTHTHTHSHTYHAPNFSSCMALVFDKVQQTGTRQGNCSPLASFLTALEICHTTVLDAMRCMQFTWEATPTTRREDQTKVNDNRNSTFKQGKNGRRKLMKLDHASERKIGGGWGGGDGREKREGGRESCSNTVPSYTDECFG